jgi:hypothetical protein
LSQGETSPQLEHRFPACQRRVHPRCRARSPTPRRMPSHRSTSGTYPCPPFGPSAHPRDGSASLWPRLSAVGCLTSVACAGPTMPSADFCGAVREDSSALSPIQDTPQISRGKLSYLLCIDAGFIKYAPAVDGGLCGCVPTRPERTTPRIRFVSLAPHLRSTLPSDPTSRRRPGASLVLRLHKYLDGGLSPPSMTACTAHTVGGMSRALHRVGSMPWLGQLCFPKSEILRRPLR